MFFQSLALASALGLSTVLACPDHNYHGQRKTRDLSIHKRQEGGAPDWSYDESHDWSRLSEDYSLCITGTKQSPIPLALNQGLSLRHNPIFNHYDSEIEGEFYNWGYGPAMTYSHPEGDYSSLPSITFEEEDGQNETVHLSGWHIHTPADHTVQGDRSRAELHLVHANHEGDYRAVLAIRIDPGNVESAFLNSMPDLISYRDGEERVNATSNPQLALDAVDDFNEFWTYEGSLTSPPCTEGLRWYMARNIMFVSDAQLSALLNVSHFSARAVQQVWRHQINV